MAIEELKSLKSPSYPNYMQGENGVLHPITPRTMAFNQLGGTTSDLPLRSNMAEPGVSSVEVNTPRQQPQPTMYFPPPPKKPTKAKTAK